MRRFVPLLAIGAFATALTGCETLKSLDIIEEDPDVERSERLRVPPDLSATGINDQLAIPGSGLYSDSRQGQATLAPGGRGLEIRKASGQRWLQTQAAPADVWGELHAFLEAHGLEIAREVPALGVIETEWLPRAVAVARGALAPAVTAPEDANIADRYVFRLEPGVEAGTTEVYVAHRRIAQQETGDDAAWIARAGDPFLEAEMLRGLMVHLGAPAPRAQQQIATAEAARPQAELVRDEHAQLVLREGFFDAWRRVGVAIDRLGFTLEDRDRSVGRYFVRYDARAETRGEEESFLDALAFWRDKPNTGVSPYVIELNETDGQTRVQVLDEEGAPAAADVADPILALLYEQLR